MHKNWDVFISHASEDKKEVAFPLANILIKKGVKVWLDFYELKLGDSLREKIDEGLRESEFAVIILSHQFFKKKWAVKELNALFSLEQIKGKLILPIRHNISNEEIITYTPLLADKITQATGSGLDQLADSVIDAIISKRTDHEYSNLFRLKSKHLRNTPGLVILLKCIFEEGVKHIDEIGFARTMGGGTVTEEGSAILRSMPMYKYAIGGTFHIGIESLITKGFLLTDDDNGANFHLNFNLRADLNRFFKTNENTITAMIDACREEPPALYYRDDAPVKFKEIAKALTFE